MKVRSTWSLVVALAVGLGGGLAATAQDEPAEEADPAAEVVADLPPEVTERGSGKHHIMVCKSPLKFSADLLTRSISRDRTRYLAPRVEMRFRKSKRKADPVGTSLKNGECGLLGSTFRAHDESRTSSWKIGVTLSLAADGGVTWEVSSPNFAKLTEPNGNVMHMPVQIYDDGRVFLVQ